MKLISFTRLGKVRIGAVVGAGVIDLTVRLNGGVTSLREVLEAGRLESVRKLVLDSTPDFAMSDITLLPVIPDPSKIFCIGLNYETHRAETKRPDVEYPTIFTRYPDSQVAHRQPIVKPGFSDRLDYEGEMAVVIGKGGRFISEEAAMLHVAGYSCYNDVSVRDWQRHTSQFTPGKNFPATGAFGPQLVTADEVGDYTQLPIQTRLNGEVMQSATLADLIFPVERLISYISTFTPLTPGDVIVTGTPGGVGDRRDPAVYMKRGDIVEVEIGQLGTLINPVEEE